MSLRLEQIAEQKILEAMQAGFFDHLQGAGKPIEWKNEVDAAEDWRLAFDVLQKNGYRLPWMDKRIEIEQGFESAVNECKTRLTRGDTAARVEFFRQVELLNRAIFDYNLIVPLVQFQRQMYDSRLIFNELKKSINYSS